MNDSDDMEPCVLKHSLSIHAGKVLLSPPRSFYKAQPLLLYVTEATFVWKNSVSQIDERRIKAPRGSGAETDVWWWLRGRL